MKSPFPEKQIGVLSELGLSRTQAILYLTSLKHGMLSALGLSRLTQINRQQIYEDAEKLLQMGLYDITRRQRRKYIAALPTRLLSVGRKNIVAIEETLAELSKMMPSFEALTIPSKNKVTARYYEGLDKLNEAYENELETAKNTEVLSFAGLIDHTFEFFPEKYWDAWNKKFVRQKSKSRMLVHSSEVARGTAQRDKDYNRETRYLEHFPLKVNIDVFNNVVLIVSYNDEFGVWLESPVLAESYRIMFNALWELAKPFE